MLFITGFPLFRSAPEDFALFTSQKNRFPASRPDDRAVPSGRSSVHCSIRSDNVPYRPDAQTDLASFVRTT
jgi:hypothetical protein